MYRTGFILLSMKLSEIQTIADSQKQLVLSQDTGLPREVLPHLPKTETHALVVSGIRRCGKSTLLLQFVKSLGKPWFYLNFEDFRLYQFSIEDFELLDRVIDESGARVLLFDEIQAAPNWELYVRQKLDQHFQVLATGSNASLLSRELGTKLTGRHLSQELFPFSYTEYLAFLGLERGLQSLDGYLESGGFPEYLKTNNPEILVQLQSDILYRDIAVRYGIKDVGPLKRLFVLLMSNAGHLISPSKLAPAIGVKSPSTVLTYFSYLEAAYLVSLVPCSSWSPKAQLLAPKKLYVTDSGLIHTSTLSSSRDMGQLLENYVFVELRRRTKDILYYSGSGRECDFVVNPRGRAPLCMQVCRELNSDNEAREVEGLLAALDSFKVDVGYILTGDTRDTIVRGDKRIEVLPAYAADFAWLLSLSGRMGS